jgi:hypothetical protein
MLTYPWLDVLKNPHPVSKEELARAQQFKQLIPAQRRFHLRFIYKEDK